MEHHKRKTELERDAIEQEIGDQKEDRAQKR
jgi:hypothetical protein